MTQLYLTRSELLRGTVGVNWKTVPVTGATDEEQLDAQLEIISTSTDWIITEAGQKLHATQDQEILEIGGRRVRRYPDGTYYVQLNQSPIIQVVSVEFSPDANTWGLTNYRVLPANRSAIKLIAPSSGTFMNMPGSAGWLRVTYINGFPNALLTADAAQGALSVVVDDPTGFLTGDIPTIYDSPGNEDVTLSGSYVQGAATLPLTAALAHAHVKGTRISLLPPSVRRATLLIATHEARERGRQAITVASSGRARSASSGPAVTATRTALEEEAANLLRRVKRII